MCIINTDIFATIKFEVQHCKNLLILKGNLRSNLTISQSNYKLTANHQFQWVGPHVEGKSKLHLTKYAPGFIVAFSLYRWLSTRLQ